MVHKTVRVWPPPGLDNFSCSHGSSSYLPRPTSSRAHLRSGLNDLLQDADVGLNFQKILSRRERIFIASRAAGCIPPVLGEPRNEGLHKFSHSWEHTGNDRRVSCAAGRAPSSGHPTSSGEQPGGRVNRGLAYFATSFRLPSHTASGFTETWMASA